MWEESDPIRSEQACAADGEASGRGGLERGEAVIDGVLSAWRDLREFCGSSCGGQKNERMSEQRRWWRVAAWASEQECGERRKKMRARALRTHHM
jgi:hypothetical protein